MDVVESAYAALQSGEFSDFAVALRDQRFPDSYRAILSSRVSNVLARNLGSRKLVDWIMRPASWDVSSFGPDKKFTPSETILHLLWQNLSGLLAKKMIATSQEVPIAPRGAILCFFGGTKLSIIVNYRQQTLGGFDLRPITALKDPAGLFELPTLFAGASPEQRNLIKGAAHSVDKLVFQRGVLIHVDRQREDVFGPSIDTVLLAETLAQWLETRPAGDALTALEVGTGSGLLCTLLASAENVERVYAMDLNPRAVICTLKNLKINGIELDSLRPNVKIRGEGFDPRELSGPFDLVVCNPPYIPRPPSGSSDKSGYDLAIGGLELCRDLLGALDSLLVPKGELLLMTSSTSFADIEKCVPPAFDLHPCLEGKGIHVPLDLDRLWQEPEWRNWLLEERRVHEDNDGVLWHDLQPFWIRRK